MSGGKDVKKILFTGGTGFVGKNIIPILKEKYIIVSPSRRELDLKDTEAVKEFVQTGHFDIVLHAANPNPVKSSDFDKIGTMFEDSMRVFMNLYKVSNMYEKMIYLGSGAEYDKTQDIIEIKEDEVFRSLPKDIYGCSKYIMNELALYSKNIYNLRLFACYGPYDHESKFITHCIRCCLNNEPITIRQNCYFDYIHVYDLEKVIEFMIENDMAYHDYNIASGRKYSLEEIALKVKKKMNSEQPVRILSKEWNKEYTADISRLEKESHLSEEFIDLDQGIRMQIEYEKEYWDEKKSC